MPDGADRSNPEADRSMTTEKTVAPHDAHDRPPGVNSARHRRQVHLARSNFVTFV